MSLKVQPRLDVANVDSVKVQTNARIPEPEAADTGFSGKRASLGAVVNLKEVEAAVDSVNGAIEPIHRGLRFVVHEETSRIMVRVVDLVTEEVIKEIPPEEVLDTAARIREMIGILIDEWA